jgi:ElaB/YqjD/DUF883 family membrane-anchored ribosome-binding protein
MLDSIRATANNARAKANAASIDGNLNDAGTDVKALVKDAQALLTAAASLTGTKADELRERGMAMLDTALGKGRQYQDQAVVKGKELARNADVYVKDNPWRTVAVAAGVGLLVGVLLGRK